MPLLDRESTATGLRIELFVRDLDISMSFYREALGFRVVRSTPGAYAALAREGAIIGLNLASGLPADHPVSLLPAERPGRGVEIVLVVRDAEESFAQALRSGRAIFAPLTIQPWGLTDFRIIDPDGYYVRVTGISAS
jgi:lactoylglutathione lyase